MSEQSDTAQYRGFTSAYYRYAKELQQSKMVQSAKDSQRKKGDEQ